MLLKELGLKRNLYGEADYKDSEEKIRQEARLEVIKEAREKLDPIAPKIIMILNEVNNKEMGETGIYEEIVVPFQDFLEELSKEK